MARLLSANTPLQPAHAHPVYRPPWARRVMRSFWSWCEIDAARLSAIPCISTARLRSCCDAHRCSYFDTFTSAALRVRDPFRGDPGAEHTCLHGQSQSRMF